MQWTTERRSVVRAARGQCAVGIATAGIILWWLLLDWFVPAIIFLAEELWKLLS